MNFCYTINIIFNYGDRKMNKKLALLGLVSLGIVSGNNISQASMPAHEEPSGAAAAGSAAAEEVTHPYTVTWHSFDFVKIKNKEWFIQRLMRFDGKHLDNYNPRHPDEETHYTMADLKAHLAKFGKDSFGIMIAKRKGDKLTDMIPVLNDFSFMPLHIAFSPFQNDVSEDELENLKRFKSLTGLDVSMCKVNDKKMKLIGELTNITDLDINDNPDITDEGLQNLANLRNLKVLDIGYTIENYAPRENYAARNKKTNNGLGFLKSLKQLDHLRIKRIPLKDAGLDNLQGLDRLMDLDLGNTQITDKGLSKLAGFKHLESLDIDHNHDITEKGIEALADFPSLKELSALGVGASYEFVEKFKKDHGLKSDS